ncbi:hypothetical protein QQS21_006643 [Conoideocrella luteorostrata]|uniref:Amidase domain-containing protein n=1 Tax=Conoideocrella luteorostrata TaxID=1105319 RepID=A0AAJ0CM92_9HYPO|nr:hypothetical protein QQS21_006643 [Conoideocrella luteorostrata]
MSWEEAARAAQQSVIDSIPSHWRIAPEIQSAKPTNVSRVIEDKGLLNAKQLEITSKDGTDIVQLIRDGVYTAVDVADAFCARAALAHQLTNCLMRFFPEEALAEAARLDKAFKETGKLVGPLHGLPISIKDTYHVKGKASTLGYVALKDNIVDDDAVVVQLLRKAGAIIHCKTTMPQAGMALETSSNLWGQTVNPFNTSFGGGGSSGGDGVLIAMRGAVAAPMTDIGGSIRSPAAFNGLYAIRPTADRMPKTGMHSWNPSQMSIRVSCGPGTHSMRDLKHITPVLNGANFPYDVSSVPVPWRHVPPLTGKLTFGLLAYDGVVTPHPPVLRALKETAEKLEAAGHEVIEFKLPFSAWDIKQSTFNLYFQTGAAEQKELMKSTGEPILPVFKHYLDTFNVRALAATECLQLNRELVANKLLFRQAWDSTAQSSSTKTPIHALLCPVAPSLSIPHDFPIWWGYTSLFNYLDYPSTVLPCRKMKVDPALDAKNPAFVPNEGFAGFDKVNWEMYDVKGFADSPITIQVVARPFQDEELMEISEVVDNIINA